MLTPAECIGKGGRVEPVTHEEAIPRLAEHLQPVFEASPDGVYVWLDETHWTCNERFAELFGFTIAELENTPNFLQLRVHEDDQERFSSNYWNRVQELASPVTFRFRGVRKDGSTFPAETDMIPLTFGGHTIAYHFVRTVGD
jgi:PAS domain S-box-containing protein